MPKFQDMVAWQQAELLMQPAFIRLIDNIRKQLDESTWKGAYENVQVWAETVTEAEKARVNQLQAELEAATPDRVEELEQELSRVPAPFPGYVLCLSHEDERGTVDLWEWCYPVCFQGYDHSEGRAAPSEVQVDLSLFDDTGDVDWLALDEKASRVVAQVFAALP